MSDETSREITVKVEKQNTDLEDEIERLTQALEQRDAMLQQIAEEEFEKQKRELADRFPIHRERIMDVETPSQYEFVKAFLANEPIHKKSKGTVKLYSGSTEDPMEKQFDTAEDMLRFVYSHANNPKSPHYEQMRNVRKELRSKFKGSMPRKLDLTHGLEKLCAKELGKENYSHQEFTEWIQRKMREANVEK